MFPEGELVFSANILLERKNILKISKIPPQNILHSFKHNASKLIFPLTLNDFHLGFLCDCLYSPAAPKYAIKNRSAF